MFQNVRIMLGCCRAHPELQVGFCGGAGMLFTTASFTVWIMLMVPLS